jgi:CDP-paratose 2-epimerase
MNIVVTGSAGFLGNWITNYFADRGHRIIGIDNLSRKGSQLNAKKQIDDERVKFIEADISSSDQINFLFDEDIDWIIDCAAEPSVLAGVGKGSGSRNLINNNLVSTINLLEICKEKKSGFILMSTSRVYSINALINIDIDSNEDRFICNEFVDETFSTQAPISLYGSTKLTSEILAKEYSQMYGFPLWINRCGVIAGAGQFGKIDQGVFSYWIYSWMRKKPIRYIGFEGSGKQVRDVVHPLDICDVMAKQIEDRTIETDPIYCIGGGPELSMSLKELSEWCYYNIESDDSHLLASTEIRPFDIPIYITNTAKAADRWNFKNTFTMTEILEEIRDYAVENPEFIPYLYDHCDHKQKEKSDI